MNYEILPYDIVVLGCGGAGVTAAITAKRLGTKVALLSKDPIGYGNTRIAGGNMSRPGLAAGDSSQAFFDDLIKSGEGINNPRLARLLAEEAPRAADWVESLGHLLRRDSDGRLSASVATRGGGHSFARNVHNQGEGKSLGQSLRTALVREGIDLFGETAVYRLLTEDRRVRGLAALRILDGQLQIFAAKAVILATGGAGFLYYPHTDCMPSATGDGYALALEAGAELVDMEFFQFLPFATTHPKARMGQYLGDPGNYPPQARLLNSEGEVVLTGLNRMTRARVARAIAEQVALGKTSPWGGLYLDLSGDLQTEEGRAHWERMKDWEIMEIAKAAYGPKAHRWEEPWDVLPTAHTTLGGVLADEWCRSQVMGLYAAGEAMGGIHGANRLGSAALAEVFVFGHRAGLHAAEYALSQGTAPLNSDQVNAVVDELGAYFGREGKYRPVQLIRRLQDCMWNDVGIVRTEESCSKALVEIREIAEASEDLSIASGHRYNTEALDTITLKLMLMSAETIARAALERRESRGAHLRLDYPERDDGNWLKNIVIGQDESFPGRMRIRFQEAKWDY